MTAEEIKVLFCLVVFNGISWGFATQSGAKGICACLIGAAIIIIVDILSWRRP